MAWSTWRVPWLAWSVLALLNATRVAACRPDRGVVICARVLSVLGGVCRVCVCWCRCISVPAGMVNARTVGGLEQVDGVFVWGIALCGLLLHGCSCEDSNH